MLNTTIKIMVDAEHQRIIPLETLELLKVPANFEDGFHIYLAAEHESPVVAEMVNTTHEEGRSYFRAIVSEAIDKIESDPGEYMTLIIDDEDANVPEGLNGLLRSDLAEWVENVVAAKVNVMYVMWHG